MYQKTRIHYSHICEQYISYISICFPHMTNGWLHIKNWHIVYVSHHFSTIINIVICQLFFNTLNICLHINDFLIHWRFFELTIVVHMLKNSKGENVFSKYMDKLLCFQVYGYYKVIKVSGNTNTIDVSSLFHIWQIYGNWYLVYNSHNFSIIANCYFSSNFWYTKSF